MFKTKLKTAMLLALALSLGVAGAGLLAREKAAPGPEEPPAGGAKSPASAGKPAGEKHATKEGGKVVVSGRVLGPDGQPVACARVVLPGAVWGSIEKGALAEEKSGADGRFRIAVERSQLVSGRALVAAAEGYGLDWAEADKLGRDEVTLRLAKDDVPVAGRLLDYEGRPVKGVPVFVMRVEAPAGGNLGPVLKSIRADLNSFFHHPMRALRLAPDSKVFAPVKTDGEGRFRFTGLGRERLVVLYVGGETTQHSAVYVLTRPGVNVAELVQAAAEKRSDGLPRGRRPAAYGPTFDHTAGPTRPVVGVVRDRTTGKPVADVWVRGSADLTATWGENATYVMTRTDKDGRYRLVGLPKAPSLNVSASGGRARGFLPTSKTVGDTAGLGPIALDLELPRGVRVHGRVTDKATGKPVPASLVYHPYSGNNLLPPGYTYGGCQTEKDGSFSLVVPPGPGFIVAKAEVEGPSPYTVAALDPADRPKAFRTEEEFGEDLLAGAGAIVPLASYNAYRSINPAEGAEPETCDIQFKRGQTRTGSVVGPDGKAVAGAHVRGLVPGETKALPDSSFKALVDPDRPRLLTFLHKERKLVGQAVLQPGTKGPVTVRLQPSAAITGRLLGEDGKPLAGVTVGIQYSKQSIRAWGGAVTDARGRFRVEDVFPGLEFGLALQKGGRAFNPDEKHEALTLEAGTKDLGDITARPAE